MLCSIAKSMLKMENPPASKAEAMEESVDSPNAQGNDDVPSKLPYLSEQEQDLLFTLLGPMDPAMRDELLKTYPKLRLHELQMRRRMASIAGMPLNLVSASNTTNTSLKSQTNPTNNTTNTNDPPAKRAHTGHKIPNKSRRNITDEMGFQYPPLRHVAKQSVPLAEFQSTSQQNKFNKLDEEELNDETLPLPPPEAKKVKILPIHMRRKENLDYEEVLNHIGEKIEKNFTAKPITGWVKIMPDNIEAHRSISRFLIEENVESYVIPMGLIKPHKAVIRGLSTEYGTEKIETALKKYGVMAEKVVQLISRRGEKRPLPLYLIHIPNTQEQKRLLDEIRHINYIRVSFESYRAPYRVTQCYKCQYWHHTQEHCHVAPRCVKCGEPHNSNECRIKEITNREELRCCNCNQTGHPASYRGCPKFPQPRKLNANPMAPNALSYAKMATRQTANSRNEEESVRAPSRPTQARSNSNTQQVENYIQNTNSQGKISKIASLMAKIEQHITPENLDKLITVLEEMVADMDSAENYEDKIFAFLRKAPRLLTYPTS